MGWEGHQFAFLCRCQLGLAEWSWAGEGRGGREASSPWRRVECCEPAEELVSLWRPSGNQGGSYPGRSTCRWAGECTAQETSHEVRLFSRRLKCGVLTYLVILNIQDTVCFLLRSTVRNNVLAFDRVSLDISKNWEDVVSVSEEVLVLETV